MFLQTCGNFKNLVVYNMIKSFFVDTTETLRLIYTFSINAKRNEVKLLENIVSNTSAMAILYSCKIQKIYNIAHNIFNDAWSVFCRK